MREILRLIVAPVMSLFTVMVGMSFFNTYISVRIVSEGRNNMIAGIVYSAYYLGMMLGAVYMERLIRLTGHIRAFALFASCLGGAIVLQSFFLSPYVWLSFRFLAGICCAGLFIVIESWLLLLSSAATRGVVLSLYMVSLYTAQSLSQFLLNVVEIVSIIPFNIAIFFCSISVIPVCLMRASAPSITESEYINIFYLFRKTPLGFVGNFIAGLILSSFYALGPIYARSLNFSIFKTSMVMAVTIFGGMALQWPLGKLSDMIQRRKVIIFIAAAMFILSGVLFFYTTIPFWLLMIILFLFGGFSFTLYPISITYCCDFFSSSGITAVTCAALIIYGIGCIFGPLIAPLVINVTTGSGLFLFSSVLSLGLMIYGIYRHKKLPKEQIENKETYQVLPNITPTISKLDPRSPEDE